MKTVILAAGFGSRLWPISTSEQPKQFCYLVHSKTPTEATYEISQKFVSTDDLYILTLEELHHFVQKQIPEIHSKNIIFAPARHNTLPHVLFAMNKLAQSDDEQVLFLPVDHHHKVPTVYVDTMRSALGQCVDVGSNYLLVTDNNEYDSNSGYVVDNHSDSITFKEKPTPEELDDMKSHGKIYKDTAAFVVSKKSLSKSLNYVQDASIRQRLIDLLYSGSHERDQKYLLTSFLDIQATLFEVSKNIKVVPIKDDFVDIGRYEALYRLDKKDLNGNVIHGNFIIAEGCTNCLLINKTTVAMVAVNLSNTIMVKTAQGVLSVPFESAEKVGAIYKKSIKTLL